MSAGSGDDNDEALQYAEEINRDEAEKRRQNQVVWEAEQAVAQREAEQAVAHAAEEAEQL